MSGATIHPLITLAGLVVVISEREVGGAIPKRLS